MTVGSESAVRRVLVMDQSRGVWGAQRYLLRLAPLLRRRGYLLTLAAPSSLEFYRVWQAAGHPAVDVDLPVDRSIRKSGRPAPRDVLAQGALSARTAWRIAVTARAGRHDILWANAHWIDLDTAVAGHLCGKPVVLHLHEQSLPGFGSRLRAGAVGIATQSIAVSERLARDLPAAARRRVRVIPNGVDPSEFSPPQAGDLDDRRRVRADLGIGDDDLMVLAATRIDPDKRIEDLIAAIGSVDDSRARLVIAGSTSGHPEYEAEVRRRAAAARIGRVTLCGKRSDMQAMYRASDLVVHTGLVEGMPLTVLEAQACGRPVVAYRAAGVSEAVRDGKTGFVVAPGDVEGLVTAVNHLADDADLRQRMGLSARTHVVLHHHIQDQADCVARTLSDLWSRSSSTGRAFRSARTARGTETMTKAVSHA